VRDDAEPAPVDPAWRSQLLIGIVVLNWLHQDVTDRGDLTELANQLVTPGQRRLRLAQRWAQRDLASFEHPDTHAPANVRGSLASRADHTCAVRRNGFVGAGRRHNWGLDFPGTALLASSLG